jgi:hypothetical protein
VHAPEALDLAEKDMPRPREPAPFVIDVGILRAATVNAVIGDLAATHTEDGRRLANDLEAHLRTRLERASGRARMR